MQLPPFVRVEFQTFLPTCARGAPNHLFLVGKRGLGFKYVHIFHVKQVDALRGLGAGTAIVTRGEHGAVLAGVDKRFKVGVYPVKPVDATGTGDAFTAGFLYGVLRGVSDGECLKFGSAMGASCVRSVGATTGVFNASELADFVERNPLDVEVLDK